MQFGTRTRLAVAASVGALVVVGPMAAVSQGQTHRVASEPDPALCAAAKRAVSDLQSLETQLRNAEAHKNFFNSINIAWLKTMVERSKALVNTIDADLRKACGI